MNKDAAVSLPADRAYLMASKATASIIFYQPTFQQIMMMLSKLLLKNLLVAC